MVVGAGRLGEIRSLQAGRAFATLAVLLFHTNTVLANPGYLGRDIFPIFNPGRAGVEFFFVLSGMVIALAHKSDFAKPGAVVQFLWKRFRRLYPPLWVALLCVLPIYLFTTTTMTGTGKVNPLNTLLAFLIAPAPYETLLWVEWTLRHEVLFYLCFCVILWRPKLGGALFALWAAASTVSVLFKLEFPLKFFLSYYHALFAMGLGCALLYLRTSLRRPLLLLWTGVALFSLIWGLNMAGVLTNDHLSTWPYGLGAAMILLGAADWERKNPIVLPRVLALIGDASYSIYLVHLPVVSVMAKVSTRIAAMAPVPDVVLFLATGLVSLAAGVVFHWIVEKPILKALPGRLPRGRQTSTAAPDAR